MNDMSSVIIPKSDQLNADSLLAGPMTVTVKDVQISGGQEQPVSIALRETDLFFRPCKSMSRCLVSAWGADAKAYIGRSLTLYRDPDVKWGGLAVGGIRISHMSDIDGAQTMMLTATKGSRKPHKVLPLASTRPADTKQAKAEEWLAWLKDELAGADQAKVKETFTKAEKTLARLKEGFPDLYAEAMKLAPTTEAPSIDTLIAKIGAADSIGVDQLDKESDGDRAFMTPDEVDRLDQALAARREALRTPETAA